MNKPTPSAQGAPAGAPAAQVQLARLLKFTVTGHTLDYSNPPYRSCHCSGYESPETFGKPYHWWAHPAGQMSTHFADYHFPPDGVPVLDIRAAVDTPAGYSWVFRGPLVDVDLPDGACDALPKMDGMMGAALMQSGFAGLLVTHAATRATAPRGSLDSVSVPEFVQGWREHGARVGRAYVRQGVFSLVWEAQPVPQVAAAAEGET